jgi:GT2 family glycosyltransferase
VRIRWIESGESVGAARGEVVACIPVYGGHEVFVECLTSVIAHTPPMVRIMVLDDASPDERTADYVRGLGDETDDRELLYLRRERNIGFPANVNGAFAAAAPADVVVLNSDCAVAEGWLDALRDAAYDNGRVATATALSNHGSIVSTPNPNDASSVSFGREDLDRAAAAVRRRSRRLRPRLPTAIGHCMYVRRTALELVGDFDIAFTPGYGEEVDFSQRCLLNGLCHVLADDVLVLHHGGGSFAFNEDRRFLQEAHEREISMRYPYYHHGLRALAETEGRLSLSLKVAGRALTGLAVTLDLRGLRPGLDDEGMIAPMVSGLLSTEEVRLTALAPETLRAKLAAEASWLGEISWLDGAQIGDAARADVVHRLYPIARLSELDQLERLGERKVLTHHDLSRFHNPAYFETSAEWEDHRLLTRRAMSFADGVICLSESGRADALAEGLVDPDRARTVRPGIDHGSGDGQPRVPQLLRVLPDEVEVVLCLGPSSPESNRLFALRLVEQLQQRHGWDGQLLLVGPDVEPGSSYPRERAHLTGNPRLAEATQILPAVDNAERAWLLRRSRLVLHVSVGNGVELIPFEAAAHGTPSLWAPGTSLGELVDEGDATLVPWDAEASADRALTLLRDPVRRERNVAATRNAAASLTWETSATGLLAAYDDAFARPARAFGVVSGRGVRNHAPARSTARAAGRQALIRGAEAASRGLRLGAAAARAPGRRSPPR